MLSNVVKISKAFAFNLPHSVGHGVLGLVHLHHLERACGIRIAFFLKHDIYTMILLL